MYDHTYVYEIQFEENVEEEMARIRRFDGRRILQAIHSELGHEPARETRHRKILHGVKPPFKNVPPVWELRVGEYRVFYDVDEEGKKVHIRAVRHKPPHKTTEDII
jgi:mRNA-degrading endonuclease RelE of RelBE toxin-antitoxin system